MIHLFVFWRDWFINICTLLLIELGSLLCCEHHQNIGYFILLYSVVLYCAHTHCIDLCEVNTHLKQKKKGKWAYICMYHVAFYTLVCLQCKHCIACVECFCIFLLALARMWGGKGGGQMGREGCLWELEREGFNFCLHIKVHLWTLS